MITEVHIKNFRCFAAQRVKLGPFTVLIGKNDTGKSSFLDALQLMTRAPKNAHEGWNESVRIGGARSDARVSLMFEKDAVLSSSPERPQPNYQPDKLSPFMSRFVAQIRGPYRLDVGAMRLPSKVGGPFAASPLPENGTGLASIIERLPFSRMRDLQAAFLSRVPSIKEVRSDPLGDQQGTKELRFELTSGGIVRAHRISDGVLLLLAFVTVVCDEFCPAVLMIEEPENGIHPKQLREVLRLLYSLTVREKDPIQVILTTHSPYVLDFVPPKTVRVFRRDAASGNVEVLPFADMQPIKEMLDSGYTPGEAWFNSEEDDLHLEKASNADAGAK